MCHMRQVMRVSLVAFVLFVVSLTSSVILTANAAEEDNKVENNSGTITQQIGVKSPSTDLWRAIRQRPGEFSAEAQSNGLDTGALINPNGQEWRNFRMSKLVPYTMYVLGGVLLALFVFRLIRGKIKIKAGRSGNKIPRFTNFQRFVHWSVAILFVILGFTGVILTLGRFGLAPLIGKSAFGVIANFGKILHDYLGPVFAIMLVVMLFAFMKDNVAKWVDVKWLLKGGGMFGGHASAGRYNAGEKIWYWIAMIVGAVVIVSGLILDFPVFDLVKADIEQSQVVHAIASIGLLAVAFGHIFMGTIAMEGAFETMQTGECDENWAKEHHDLWYQDLKAQGLVGTTKAVASVAGTSSMPRESRDTAPVSRVANDVVDSSVQDNLTKIEGIGPTIEGILKEAGLITFSDIKNSSRDDIKAILDAAGSRYRMHEPKSWPQQAELADKDAWDELSKLQDHLFSGRK